MLLDFNSIYSRYNLNIKGVLHIGAHYGQEDSLYRHKNVQNVMYFEPLTKNFNVLESRVSKNSILHKIALGNEEKNVNMYVESVNTGMSSSILKPEHHLVQYPHIVFDEIEEVKMNKLDNIEFNRNDYNFINIDVQGYELEVFKGAEKTLEHIDYIFSEINNVHLYENGTLLPDLIDFLSKYNFKLVEENWAGETWGDGFFIKKKQ
jgi:FkbM family methyltransferase